MRTIGRWIAEGMPVEKEGGYSITKVLAWRREQDEALRPEANNGSNWQELFEKSRAQLKEIELDIARGNLIDRETIERECAERVLEVAHALDRMGSALAPKCESRPARKIKTIIDGYTREIRENYADQGAVSGGKRIRRGRGRPPKTK